MQSIYRSKESDHNLNVWEMLCREVYEPIGVLYMHGNATTDGVPLTAWGAYPNVDDMVKIAGLVQRLGLDGLAGSSAALVLVHLLFSVPLACLLFSVRCHILP